MAFKTRAAAEKRLRRSHGAGLSIYLCKYGRDHWHLTSQEPINKKEAIPSAAKLRRRLENYGREIEAAWRRFNTSEAALKLAQEKAEQENAEVMRALEVMSARSYGRKVSPQTSQRA